MVQSVAFVGGALMGAASALHCAGQCGAISSSLMLAATPAGSGRATLRPVLAIHGGRVTTYVVFGIMVGWLGSGFAVLAQLASLPQLFRVLAAGGLIWVGLSVAGVVPRLSMLDRLAPLGSVAVQIHRLASRSPFALGCVWGLAPCGMVYAALVNAMLSGSALGGASFMAGFGLATVPVVAGASFGVAFASRFARHGGSPQIARRVIGGLLVALALGSLLVPGAGVSSIFCAPSAQ